MRQYLPFLPQVPVVSVVRMTGVIGAGGRFGAGLSDATLGPVIDRAFSRGKPKAVALLINSPGGSPAQSSLIAGRIRRLSEEHSIPVHAFVEDLAASGGYWLAAAADHIWVDETSIVGSIGVISAGFGFHELIGRYGVERRVHTAGTSKSFLDPFRPERAEDIARLNRVLEQFHTAFKAHVQGRRGAKLATDTDLYSGDFWAGREAVTLGLADGVAHPGPKMKEIYGDKVRLVPHGIRRPLFQRLGAQLAGGAVGAALDGAEERGLRARYGL